MILSKPALFFSFFIFILAQPAAAQLPEARELFAKMRDALDNVQRLSYKAETTVIRGSEFKDSVYRATSYVQAYRREQDSVFGYYFHVQLNTNRGNSDFCYEGKGGLDVYHSHVDNSLSKTVFIIEPARLAHVSVTGSSETAEGFIKDIVLQKNLLLPGVDEKTVKVFDGNTYWIVQWESGNVNTSFAGFWQLQVDKKTMLIRSLQLKSVKNGQTYTRKVTISDLHLNDEALRAVCPFTDFTGYRLVHQKAKD